MNSKRKGLNILPRPGIRSHGLLFRSIVPVGLSSQDSLFSPEQISSVEKNNLTVKKTEIFNLVQKSPPFPPKIVLSSL